MKARVPRKPRELRKSPTGIPGLDDILGGGFPAARPTLICGGAGCGKTTLAMEFLVRGAREFDEPGLFMSFEETCEELTENFASLGFGLDELVRAKKLKICTVAVSQGQFIEAGSFSLDALLVMLKQAIDEIGAKRVVLDTIEAIFSVLSLTDLLRNEVAGLFHWLRRQGVAAVVTGERGNEDGLTRHGFEEYISDCVLLLDHRIQSQTSTRRLRVIKYRGSAHAADEFPFLIGETGFSVLPITSIALNYAVSTDRVATGVKEIDQMLGGKGVFRATAVLVTGRPGTGKSSLAAAFASAACERGERCLYYSFEESSAQVVRNMQSIGIDLGRWVEQGLLTMRAFRPSFRGLEEHLVSIAHEARTIRPQCVVMDPVTDFVTVDRTGDVKSMLTRIMDLLKRQDCTLLMTGLTAGSGVPDETSVQISSMVDTWIALDVERMVLGSRRTILIVKSRGMEHSQDMRELLMSSKGVSLRDLAPI